MNKYDLAQYNHSNIQELIRFIDQKAGALLVIYGFILTVLVGFSKDLVFVSPLVQETFLKGLNSVLLCIVGFSLIVLLFIQIYIVLFRVLKPRTAKNYSKKEKSTMYFGHIGGLNKEDFVKLYLKSSEEKVYKDLLEQIYEISCILNKKFEGFNSVLKLLYLSIVLLLIFIFLIKLI